MTAMSEIETTTVSVPGGTPALMLAEFDNPTACVRAAEKLRDAGYKHFDTHTPFPMFYGRQGWLCFIDNIVFSI